MRDLMDTTMASIIDTDPPIAMNFESQESPYSRLVDSPSPYSHLLGTTVAFSGRPEDFALKDELAAFIRVVDAEISECKRRVDGLRAALIAAEKDLAAAKTFRNLHVSIFPPIHTLPPEVLSKIFQMVVGCELTRLCVRKCAGPFALGRVCLYWRRTAESEPRLWRCFAFIKAKTDEQTIAIHNASSARLAHTLSCSASQDLTFWMDLSLFRFGSSADEAVPHGLDVFFTNSRRWYRATFCTFSYVLSSYPQLDLGDLNALQHLTLTEVEDLERDVYDLTALEKFAHAPQLRSLAITVLSDFALRSDPAGVKFPWSQLTHLHLNFNISRQRNSLLRYRLIAACSNLLSYHEEYASRWENSLASEPIICCRHLQTLRLSGIHLLSRLECPQLQHFTLPSLNLTESSDLVVDFLNRSSPRRLEHLHVRVINQQRPHLSPVLLVLPAVMELVIEAKGLMSLPLRVLKYLATNLHVVPLLQSVGLRLDMQSVTVSSSSAVELVEHLSTRAQSSKLAHFSLELYRGGGSSHPHASIYDAGPKSPLGQFLSILREASVPELEIAIITKLKMKE